MGSRHPGVVEPWPAARHLCPFSPAEARPHPEGGAFQANVPRRPSVHRDAVRPFRSVALSPSCRVRPTLFVLPHTYPQIPIYLSAHVLMDTCPIISLNRKMPLPQPKNVIQCQHAHFMLQRMAMPLLDNIGPWWWQRRRACSRNFHIPVHSS